MGESLKVHDDTNNNLPTASLCREFKALQNEQGYTISTWFVMKYSLNFAMLKLVLHSDSSQLHLYLYLIQISCINICFWNKELQTVEIIYVSLFFRQKSWRYSKHIDLSDTIKFEYHIIIYIEWWRVFRIFLFYFPNLEHRKPYNRPWYTCFPVPAFTSGILNPNNRAAETLNMLLRQGKHGENTHVHNWIFFNAT